MFPVLYTSRPAIRAGRLAALVAAFLPAGALAQEAMMAPLPVPRAALQDYETADPVAAPSGVVDEGSALVFDPALAAIGRAAAASGAHLRARAPIPVDIIRNGFAARDTMTTADRARSVGFKLGQDAFSLSTSLIAPAEAGAARDARLDWRWAQPVSSDPGLIWGVSTGGSGSVGSNPEQTGDAAIGYRQQLFPHLTLTSQLGIAGNYIFASGDGFHSALTPEVKLSVDLAKAADLPWQTSFDLSLARKLPLVASDFETRGTAMLSFKYRWQ